MRPRRSQFQLTILFILLSFCWEGRWMTQVQASILQIEGFDSSDEQIQRRSASRLLSFSNLEADRCDDFYATVCGGGSYSELIPLRLGKESWHNVLNSRLEALINAAFMGEDEPAILKVKQQYQLCMDYDQRDEMGYDSLKFLINKDSNFPMIMGSVPWNSQKLRILEPQKYDSSLFSIRVRNRKIYIDKHDVSVYGGFLSNLKNVSTISHSVMYKLRIIDAFKQMGLLDKQNEHSFDIDLYAVMDFRRDLHRIAQIKLMKHSRMTVGELQRIVSIRRSNWPQLNWESFLRDVFVNATGVQITSSTEVYVEIAYVLAMRDLILRHGSRCIANHIKLHFFETYLSETSRDMMQISRELAVAAHDTIEQHFHKSFSNLCMNQPHILRALNYMYLKQWFPRKSRDAASDMIKEIKNSLKDYVEATHMISDNGLPWAVGQIHDVTVIVAGEEKYSDYKLLDPLYKYEVPNDHLLSVLNARRYFKEYEYSMLQKSTKTTLVGLLPILEDKPHVNFEESIIYFPIGYLHRNSLSPTVPKELSYATLGYKMSLFLNEMIIRKGFPSGKFSTEGKWYEADLKNFLNKTACLGTQYNLWWDKRQTTQDEEFKKNYDEILEQFLHDNAAFEILQSAFHFSLRNDKIATRDGSSTKRMEQDFINYWVDRYCVYNSEENYNYAKLRVNNVLRNYDAFGFTFNCSTKTLMNPHDKCSFWS